jgi:hypothetical protein
MAIQSSGVITLQDIEDEFGGTESIGLSEYYRNGAYVTSNNTSVPTSGAISLSNFYGAINALLVEYEIIGGGGGGGGGRSNYNNTDGSRAGTGGTSSISGSGFSTASSTGGIGGLNAPVQNEWQGVAGEASIYGAGGAAVGEKTNGNSAPSSSYGAGGGGGGGDNASFLSTDGAGGKGGEASDRITGNVGYMPVGTVITVTVASGGSSGNGNFPGGVGAGGLVNLRKNGGAWTAFTSSGSYTV